MIKKFTVLTLILSLAFTYTFAQTCVPPNAVNIVVNPITVDISLTGADTTWEKCEFQVRELGDPTWKRARINVPPTPVALSVNVLSNLAALTTYELRTRCACDISVPTVSPFTIADTFTTGDTPSVRMALEILEIEVFPNPAADYVTISYNTAFDGMLNATIMDMSGRTISTVEYAVVSGSNAIRMDLSGIENGSYFIKVSDGNRERVESISIAK
jgi:hypothetical protein